MPRVPIPGVVIATRRSLSRDVATTSSGVGMDDGNDLIGTRRAAELLHWNQRKVQRLILRALDTGAIPIVKVGGRGDYVLHEADLPALETLAQKTP